MKTAPKHKVPFAVMYDISGAKNGSTIKDELAADWEYLVGKMGIIDNPYYQRHDRKPVVTVWGIGLNTHQPDSKDDAIAIAKYFKSKGCYVIVGSGYYWRTGTHDSRSNWKDVYAEFDLVSPWAVGRYHQDGYDTLFQNNTVPDKKWLDKRGLGYAPVIYPGFSWSNLKNPKVDESSML